MLKSALWGLLTWSTCLFLAACSCNDKSASAHKEECPKTTIACDCTMQALCNSSGIGVGANGNGPNGTPGTGFGTLPDGSTLALGPNGELQLGQQMSIEDYIWINSTSPGVVTKFSTTELDAQGKYKALARYYTGPKTGRGYLSSRDAQCGRANDPSRTTVNTNGIAFIANRSLGSVTAIAANSAACKGSNTSQSISDVKPWVNNKPTDDCILWHTDLKTKAKNPVHLVRAISSQDIYGADGAITSYVWVGDYNYNLWKLDARTGEILLATTSPVVNYGFALDRGGQLWISGPGSAALGRVNTLVNVNDEATWNQPACRGEGGDNDEPSKCVKQLLPLPNRVGGTAPYVSSVYGITVDSEQVIWAAGTGEGLYRYDRRGTAGKLVNEAEGRWSYQVANGSRGVAADAAGFVYVANYSAGGVHVFSRAKFPSLAATDYAFFATGNKPYGMAVDFKDKVWAISIGTLPNSPGSNGGDEGAGDCSPWPNVDPEYYAQNDNASVLTHAESPTTGPGILEASPGKFQAFSMNADATGPKLTVPYTYSDMTGVQTRLATGKLGRYGVVLEGCDATQGTNQWGKLFWDADTPPGTRLVWYARLADTQEGLASAQLVLLGDAPPALGDKAHGIDLPSKLANKARGRYLEIQVDLSADLYSNATPVLRGFEATRSCVNIAQ